MHHGEVVETARRDELLVEAHERGLLCVIEREVKVDDVAHRHVQLLCHDLEEEVVRLELVVDDADDGQHVHLLAQVIALVDLSVKVDGDVGYHEQWALYLDAAHLGLQRIGTAQDHAAGERQGAVKPRVQDGASVDLGVELHHAPFGVHLRGRLHTEAGRVAMGADELESRLGRMCRAHAEGKHGRVVLGHIIPLAWDEHGEGLAHVEVCEARCLELLFDVACSEEVDGRCVEHLHQLLCNVLVHHVYCFFNVSHYCYANIVYARERCKEEGYFFLLLTVNPKPFSLFSRL